MENAAVISVYSDKEALEDGVLVRLSDADRVTRTVLDFLYETAPTQAPHRWPLLDRWRAQYPYTRSNAIKALMLAMGIVGRYSIEAQLIYRENRHGGVWFAAIDCECNTLLSLRPGRKGDRTVWLMPNELCGVTLMFPEDY